MPYGCIDPELKFNTKLLAEFKLFAESPIKMLPMLRIGLDIIWPPFNVESVVGGTRDTSEKAHYVL